ncbi:MAG: FeoA family protein [Kangiellaceae bacterium]|jgi:ferrous iron transport protein A|nr:FeoA family protein [Kangiellaceae bacterium]
MTTIKELQPGQKAVIRGFTSDDPSMASRMMALGIIPGEQIEMLRSAPFGDPMQIKAGSTFISIRKVDSDFIDIQPS